MSQSIFQKRPSRINKVLENNRLSVLSAAELLYMIGNDRDPLIRHNAFEELGKMATCGNPEARLIFDRLENNSR